MVLASPIWLLLLIPWLAVLLYLLLGKPPREAVPFLWLWRGPEAKRKAKPAVAKLPVWTALLMLAALAAILAAAGPGWVRGDATPAASQGRVGIAGAAVRGKQVMVRLLNESPRRETQVSITAGGGRQIETVQLPETGERAYFFNVPADADRVVVTVDNAAVYIYRKRSWPKVEARTSLPDSLRRMLTVYAHSRPPGDDSVAIAIAADEASLNGQPGVILADAKSPATGKVIATDHAVTAVVDWPVVLAGARLATPPAGFVPLVTIDGRPAVAVRESPRQVWVGFDTPNFASNVNYVVFWTNVLDYTGEGIDDWTPKPGTEFAAPNKSQFVQRPVQSLAPWITTCAILLTLIALLTAQRRGQLR